MGMGSAKPQLPQGGKGNANVVAPTVGVQTSLGGKGVSPIVNRPNPSTSVQQPSRVQQVQQTDTATAPQATAPQATAPQATAPQATAPQANYSYTTEANRALNMPTNQGQVFDQLQQYYAPRGLGYVRPDAPSQQQLQQMSNQIASNSSAYQNTAGQFGTLYDNLISGRVGQGDINNTLSQMQQLSRTAADQYGSVNKLFENPMFNPVQTTAGVPQQRNTLGLNPAQRFTLPKETWDMNPQQLMSWIQSHERNAGRDSFMGNAAWLAGPALIGGAAASGLTGIAGTNLVNSAIGSGLENVAGVDNKATGGLASLNPKKGY